jgi:hypothetical protein
MAISKLLPSSNRGPSAYGLCQELVSQHILSLSIMVAMLSGVNTHFLTLCRAQAILVIQGHEYKQLLADGEYTARLVYVLLLFA